MAAGAPSLSRDVQEELVRRVLDGHEQSLLRLATRGKSPAAIAQLYRQYEGENAVEEALAGIKRKLEAAAGRRLKMATDPTQARVRHLPHVAVEATGADPAAVAASAGNGRMRGPARPAEPARSSETPPNGAAPASVSEPCPSGNGSPPADGSPARTAWGSAKPLVLAALEEHGELKAAELMRVTGLARSSISRALRELRLEGTIRERLLGRSPGERGGGAKVWRLARAGECVHGRPHVGCEECAPPLEGLDAPVAEELGLAGHVAALAPEFPPRFAEGSFDAQALWESLNAERQKLLATVVLREAVYPAISRVLLD